MFVLMWWFVALIVARVLVGVYYSNKEFLSRFDKARAKKRKVRQRK